MISLAAASSIVEPVEERKWVLKRPSDIVTVNRLISYLQEKGLTRVAFLYMNNAYGDGGRKAFSAAAAKAGLQIVAEEKFRGYRQGYVSPVNQGQGFRGAGDGSLGHPPFCLHCN